MERIRGFEVVADDKRRTEGALTLPKCATASSAAYDFYAPVDAVIAPMQSVMIWTDVKAYFPVDEVLLINVRSSMGKQPVMLANTQGWIDADYMAILTTTAISACGCSTWGRASTSSSAVTASVRGCSLKRCALIKATALPNA